MYCLYAGETDWPLFSYIDVTKVAFSVKDDILENPMSRCYMMSRYMHAKKIKLALCW